MHEIISKYKDKKHINSTLHGVITLFRTHCNKTCHKCPCLKLQHINNNFKMNIVVTSLIYDKENEIINLIQISCSLFHETQIGI